MITCAEPLPSPASAADDHPVTLSCPAKKLTEELGEHESRISQGRRAEWSLTEEQAQSQGRNRGSLAVDRFVSAESPRGSSSFEETNHSRRVQPEEVLDHLRARSTRQRLIDLVTPKGIEPTRSQTLANLDDFVHSERIKRYRMKLTTMSIELWKQVWECMVSMHGGVQRS